ncbi:AAA family ATPase [Mycolicibacterium fortuitum]|uniref:AAA family ATPase n=1 Tax=Mycolicibacterium fortuitum TaxID=1766 RepID=UPI001CE12CC0|nr:AAA family ATPase [Mycolicibacterium fortuitum]MCA4725813.1 AAA family ATPase [Mycolicibacterium fortuitum]
MSKDQKKALELADEQTAQKQYRKILLEEAAKPIAYSGPANGLWTGTGTPKPRVVGNGDLLGRVALTQPDHDLLDGGADFYIGETHAKVNEINVFGWANPIACTFFRGSGQHYLCDDVAVVRALVSRSGEIVDFVDETIRADAPTAPFRKRGLTIPAPPRRSKPSQPGPIPTPPQSSQPTHDQPSPECAPAPRPVTPTHAARQEGDLPPLRAEGLLREQLQAPRTKSLAPVLATLQPDQYDLVTLPAMDNVIIEGQPGTGKTIVASHRAAYLVNDDTPPENTLDGTVLVVGPTSGYSRHVQEVILRLAGPTERIKVLSLPELINKIIGIKRPPRSHKTRTWHDADWQLAKLARSALAKIKNVKGVTPLPEEIYEHLRTRPGSVTTDQEWSRYLRNLPPFKTAILDDRHAPLIAFIKWEVLRPRDFSGIEHVIVDEAQDVTPLEWLLLDEINEADAWTILGDLNQRRSDHTLNNWSRVLDVIAIEEDTPVRRMSRGYRSTLPILEFANRLLPRNQRKLHALQEVGPPPSVHKVPNKDLASRAATELERLVDAYPAGTVSAISVSPPLVTRALRARGWTNSAFDETVWRHGKREVAVLTVDEARGLEFDAVVVVEPCEFPLNVGRQGPLYTALTRANRELAVVYSQSLPDGLRSR